MTINFLINDENFVSESFGKLTMFLAWNAFLEISSIIKKFDILLKNEKKKIFILFILKPRSRELVRAKFSSTRCVLAAN